MSDTADQSAKTMHGGWFPHWQTTRWPKPISSLIRAKGYEDAHPVVMLDSNWRAAIGSAAGLASLQARLWRIIRDIVISRPA